MIFQSPNLAKCKVSGRKIPPRFSKHDGESLIFSLTNTNAWSSLKELPRLKTFHHFGRAGDIFPWKLCASSSAVKVTAGQDQTPGKCKARYNWAGAECLWGEEKIHRNNTQSSSRIFCVQFITLLTSAFKAKLPFPCAELLHTWPQPFRPKQPVTTQTFPQSSIMESHWGNCNHTLWVGF